MIARWLLVSLMVSGMVFAQDRLQGINEIPTGDATKTEAADKAIPQKMTEAEKKIPVKDPENIKNPTELDWRQPVMQPDGSVEIYQPPTHVINVLNAKTDADYRKYAKEYVERMIEMEQRVDKAWAYIQMEYEKRGLITTQLKLEELKRLRKFGWEANINNIAKYFRFTYFIKSDCPNCKKQTEVIAQLRKAYPGLVIMGVSIDKGKDAAKKAIQYIVDNKLDFEIRPDQGEMRHFNVTDAPSIVVHVAGKESVVIDKLIPAEDFIRVMSGLASMHKDHLISLGADTDGKGVKK